MGGTVSIASTLLYPIRSKYATVFFSTRSPGAITGIPGGYVALKDTLESFGKLVDGELDEYPEAAFYNVGTWRDVVEKARKMEAGEL